MYFHKMSRNLFLKAISTILIGLVLYDFCFSFMQHYNMPLDGDMAEGILRANEVNKIFQDPFGLKLVFNDDQYPNPNRFFSQWFNSWYFQHIPFLIQNFTDPISSVYLSSAIVKTLFQILFVFAILFFATRFKDFWSFQSIFSLWVISNFFQTTGFNPYMGIIDKSITYFFFYGLPLFFLIAFYFGLLERNNLKNPFVKMILNIYLLTFSTILPLSGPLIPGIILVVSFLIFINFWLTDKRNLNPSNWKILILKKENSFEIGVLVFCSIMSLYSLWLSTHNSINKDFYLPILERYQRLPNGLFYILTTKLGFPLLLLILVINIYFMRRIKMVVQWDYFLKGLKWVGLFSLVYILVLPLGGYRSYRPNILRFDTFMPITIAFFGLIAYSTFSLLKQYQKKELVIYSVVVFFLGMAFFVADEPNWGQNNCERACFEKIERDSNNIVVLPANCTVMGWEPYKNAKLTNLNGKLLKFWGITHEEKQYIQP